MDEIPNDAGAGGAVERRYFSDGMILDLCRVLEDRGLLDRPHLDELNARQALTGEPLTALLVKDGIVPQTEILKILSELSGFPFHPIAELTIQPEAIARVQARVALRYKVMPIVVENGVITLAACEVPSVHTADTMRMLFNLAVDWVLCTESDIVKTTKHFYGLGAETIDSLVESPMREEADLGGSDVAETTADAGLVKFVNQVIFEAIRMGATDIHIEPFENRLRIRYRIDGILQDIPIPKGVERLRRAISSCVKIMAEMNIAERRKPHDGRIQVRSGSEEFDLRVSVLPSCHGETCCLRILNRKSMFIDVGHLGLSERQTPAIEYLSSLPHGVVLVTGPTGSGKTTTLYAVLSRLNTNNVKIITVEDPIEYRMFGINQIQVHSQIGVTFDAVLRSILRHDPDIILIGEMRDRETADIAVRAALTGHLVFSTLHTNDAPSAVARLTDMEIEPYLVASCLEGVIAQRLVRRICNACRQEEQPTDVILEEIAAGEPSRAPGAKYWRGHGCPECNFTGYRGRIALFEIMLLNDEIRGLIVHERPSNEIRAAAIRGGLCTLRQDGWNRVLDGLTTVEEVVRVARKM